MKLTIIMPAEMKQGLDSYIARRFGSQKPRAVSLVIREALNGFLAKQGKLDEEAAGREQGS